MFTLNILAKDRMPDRTKTICPYLQSPGHKNPQIRKLLTVNWVITEEPRHKVDANRSCFTVYLRV
jgi:hypothetical protein